MRSHDVSFEKRIKKIDKPTGPITIAFVGYPAPHKGWQVFEKLARMNDENIPSLRFVYFGVSDVSLEGVEQVSVEVTAENPNAMINALIDYEVDFLLHWANCAETFSFTQLMRH